MVAESHDEKAHEAENHGMAMCQYPGVVDTVKRMFPSDQQEIDGAPHAPQGEDRNNAADKKISIEFVAHDDRLFLFHVVFF
jgi:hypothetical protein